MNRYFILWLIFGILPLAEAGAQSYYFPPLTGNTWAATDASSLGWNVGLVDDLYDFLEDRDTKAFIVLKDGRVVFERYFGTFTQDSLWYWASAGKSLTAFMVGMAKDQGLVNINSSTSTYLGEGWSSLSPEQELAITVRHQLSMTTGLNDGVTNSDCTEPSCLQYLAAPGTRWAYHNAPYTLLDQVMEEATGQALNPFFNTQVRNRTGMTGAWIPLADNNVFFSRARSMARFGSLILNRGVWNGDTLLQDQAYFSAMTTPSQTLNPSYGYLWWLNGQASYKLPGVQISFPGSLIPTAPADMYCALGKDDQKLYVVPSENLVVVRMGRPATSDLSPVPIFFDRELWERLSLIMSPTTGLADLAERAELRVFPSPARQELYLQYPATAVGYTEVGHIPVDHIRLWNTTGQLVGEQAFGPSIPVGHLVQGLYFISLHAADGSQLARKMWVKA